MTNKIESAREKHLEDYILNHLSDDSWHEYRCMVKRSGETIVVANESLTRGLSGGTYVPSRCDQVVSAETVDILLDNISSFASSFKDEHRQDCLAAINALLASGEVGLLKDVAPLIDLIERGGGMIMCSLSAYKKYQDDADKALARFIQNKRGV